MANFSKIEDYSFARLCKTFERFEIPKFQRPYSWKNKQLQDFFSSIVENENNYFIGNIISVYNKAERTDQFDPIQIIDGQQRITTILLLLAVIKKLFVALKEQAEGREELNLIDGKIRVIEDLIFWKDLENVEDDTYQPILIFNKKEYNIIFNKVLCGSFLDIEVNNIGDNEKRIITNFITLNKLVENHIKKDPLNNLIDLLAKIRELQFIFIGVSTDNDVYGIFEGFNATGLGLSVADLIKNTVLRHTKNNGEMQNSVNYLWDEMEDMFSNTTISNFPKFIRYQWISNNGYISLSNLYSKIDEEKIRGKSEAEVKAYVSELNYDSKIFLGLMYKDHEKNLEISNEVINDFKKFRYLRNEQVYEVLLSYYKLLDNNIVRPTVLSKHLRLLWYFVVRSRFISINPSDYEKIFAQHCKEVSTANGDQITQYFDIFISKLRPYVSDDEQFIRNLVSDIKYGSDNKLIHEILYTLIHGGKSGPILMNDPEIEHILPQKPKKWGLSESEISEHVHKLGNLTLLFQGDNKDVGNENIDVKSMNFSSSNFKFNRDINDIWANKFKDNYIQAIEDRGIKIAEEISGIWKL